MKAAEIVIVGLLWPPETGWVARRRNATMRATKHANTTLGVS